MTPATTPRALRKALTLAGYDALRARAGARGASAAS